MERANSATARGLQAEAKRASSGLNNIKFLEGDIEHADFPSKSFDAILCSSAIFYFDMPSTVKRLHTWLKPGGLLAYNTLQVASCYLCIRQIHLSHALHATLKATNNAPLAFLTNAQLQQHHCNFTFKLAFRSREYLKQALIIWTDTGSICRHHSRHY